MTIELQTPRSDELSAVVRVLGEWQDDSAPFQLHPGDVGWFGWHGDEVTAAALRVWVRDDRPVAIGLLDGPRLLRLAVAPEAMGDEVVASIVVAKGWATGDLWTHLRRDLTRPVDVMADLRIQTIGPRSAHVRAAVHRASFGSDRFTEDRWRAVASGPAYRQARCLVGRDGGEAVAAVTVWSAGEGKPGIVEPMGVHADHRGRGHGVAITVAGAAALRELGASSAVVGTPASNTAAVADLRRSDET